MCDSSLSINVCAINVCAHASGRLRSMITFQGRVGGGVPNDFILI